MTYNVFSGTLNPTHSLTHLGYGTGQWRSAADWDGGLAVFCTAVHVLLMHKN